METPVIELRNVWKVYKMGKVRVTALREVSLKIDKGDFIVIIGPSGSGKSTLMHMIGSLDRPTKGKVFLNGKDISRFTESELAQIRGKEIGFVFQTFNLIPTLTAMENVELPMIFQKVPAAIRKKRARSLLSSVGLGHRLKHLPHELSGGERQRVSIARALSNDPKVILADEPTGNLDTNTGQNVLDLFKQLNEERGTSIALVTHDLSAAKRAKRILHMHDGKITFDQQNLDIAPEVIDK